MLSLQRYCNDFVWPICHQHGVQKCYQTPSETCQHRVLAKGEFPCNTVYLNYNHVLEYMHLNPFDSKRLTIIVINFWKQWKIVQLLENSKDVYWTLVNQNFSDYKYPTNRIVKYITISIRTVEIAVFATEWAKKI